MPGIFAHLITNLPAMHSTLVLVCIKHLPVPTVLPEERILLRRVGPPEYRMYRCAVRYGYKDQNKGDLEELLMSGLEEFIRAEDAGALRLELASIPATAASLDVDRPNREGGSLVTGAHGPAHRSGDIIDAAVDARVQGEIQQLHQARQHGVVYILGHTNLRCKRESNFFRKFIIDDCYGFLRRNSRSSSDTLDVPLTSRLEVGMVHYI